MYYDETLLTLNYATRAMNIKNKPVMQVSEQDGKTQNLIHQIETLKKENEYLKLQWVKAVILLASRTKCRSTSECFEPN